MYTLACGHSVVPTQFAEKVILFLLNFLATLAKKQLTVTVRVYFWTLSSTPLMYMSILVPVPYFLSSYSFFSK